MNYAQLPKTEGLPFSQFWNREQKRPKPPVSRLRQEQVSMLGYMDLDEIGEEKPRKRKK